MTELWYKDVKVWFQPVLYIHTLFFPHSHPSFFNLPLFNSVNKRKLLYSYVEKILVGGLPPPTQVMLMRDYLCNLLSITQVSSRLFLFILWNPPRKHHNEFWCAMECLATCHVSLSRTTASYLKNRLSRQVFHFFQSFRQRAPHYKLEGHRFDSRWFHWNFSLT
jgi:hypothetical protein